MMIYGETFVIAPLEPTLTLYFMVFINLGEKRREKEETLGLGNMRDYVSLIS